jgi:integrase
VIRADERARHLDLPDLIDWMLYTGCRLGEALACREQTIDLDHLTWESTRR